MEPTLKTITVTDKKDVQRERLTLDLDRGLTSEEYAFLKRLRAEKPEMALRAGDVREDGKVFREANRECVGGSTWFSCADAFKNHRVRRRPRGRKYYDENRAGILEKKRAEYVRIRPVIIARQKSYRKRNRSKIQEHRRAWHSLRRQADPMFRLAHNTRRLVRAHLECRGYHKETKTAVLLGCALPVLKEHLERQFQEGMTWENRGEWHLDHIIPMAAARSEEELLALQHHTNLRPLWKADNLKKNASIPPLEEIPAELLEHLPEELYARIALR